MGASWGIRDPTLEALEEDWKTIKGPACSGMVAHSFSLEKQCLQILDGLDAQGWKPEAAITVDTTPDTAALFETTPNTAELQPAPKPPVA